MAPSGCAPPCLLRRSARTWTRLLPLLGLLDGGARCGGPPDPLPATEGTSCSRDASAAHGPVGELRPRPHFSRRDWQLCDKELDGRECVAVPLAPGGALLFSTLLPHGTPTNSSTTQRLAIQFHFGPKQAKRTGDAARLAVFGGEGRGVHC